MFLKNDSTRWIHAIDRIVDHYNNQPHKSLNSLSPNEACKEANKQQVFEINLNTNKQNMVLSDLKPGDHVRKHLLFNDKSSKGPDPAWSNQSLTISSTHSNALTWKRTY